MLKNKPCKVETHAHCWMFLSNATHHVCWKILGEKFFGQPLNFLAWHLFLTFVLTPPINATHFLIASEIRTGFEFCIRRFQGLLKSINLRNSDFYAILSGFHKINFFQSLVWIFCDWYVKVLFTFAKLQYNFESFGSHPIAAFFVKRLVT